MDLIKQKIIDKITEYDNISLFFHEIPDLDCLGSCFALKWYIKSKFPNKKVKIIGLDILNASFGMSFFVFDKRHVPNEFLASSLGIVLDTANESRVWSGRHTICKELARIDHHPKIDSICNYEWVDDFYSSTCQMVAELMIDWDERYLIAPVAKYLYAGILTDTGRFLYPSSSPSTYAITSKLVDTGFDRSEIHNAIYTKDVKETLFSSYVIRKAKFNHRLGLAYVKIPKNAFDKYGIDLRMSMIHVLNNIRGLNIWISIYYDKTAKQWKGSIRSKKIPVNKIVEKYNGGGHKLAAGFRINSIEQYKQLIREVEKILYDYIKKSHGDM